MSAPGEVAHCQAMERQLLAAQRPSAHARWGKEGPPLRCWRSLPAGTRAPAWRLLLPVLAAAAGEAQPACRDMHLTTHTRMVLPLSVIQLQENVPCQTIQLPETHSHREGIYTGTGVLVVTLLRAVQTDDYLKSCSEQAGSHGSHPPLKGSLERSLREPAGSSLSAHANVAQAALSQTPGPTGEPQPAQNRAKLRDAYLEREII